MVASNLNIDADEKRGSKSDRGSNIEYLEYKIGNENKIEICAKPLDETSSEEQKLDTANKKDDCVTRMLARHFEWRPGRGTQLGFPTNLHSKFGIPQDDSKFSVAQGTGTVAFSIGPKYRLAIQTPIDEGPFCAMIVQQESRLEYSAIYFYSNDTFAPSTILKDQFWLVRWRFAGLPTFILGIAFLVAHDDYVADRITQMHSELELMFDLISAPYNSGDSLDFQTVSRRLHAFSIASSNVIRRAEFQNLVLTIIEESMAMLVGDGPQRNDIEIQQTLLLGLKSTMKARRFDLDMLPKREETVRAMLLNLIAQRDQQISLSMGQLNLEIAQNSREIAEATMRDSSAMRTIAILTMVFLPGTAVASFFSMTMFNWAPNPGDGVASSYVWVFFVAAIPLTALVLFIWWHWERKNRRRKQLWEDQADIIELTNNHSVRGDRLATPAQIV